MKKRIPLRLLSGACIGLTISVAVTLAVSAAIGGGNYYPVPPQLVADCGTELRAMLLQTVCSLLYGAAFAGASLVWEIERWSLLRQTVTHLLICSAATLPIAYALYWMPHSLGGILRYFGIFFAIYLLIWAIVYGRMKRRVRQFNEKIKKPPMSRPFEATGGDHPHAPN